MGKYWQSSAIQQGFKQMAARATTIAAINRTSFHSLEECPTLKPDNQTQPHMT